jgi:hypothetical protein
MQLVNISQVKPNPKNPLTGESQTMSQEDLMTLGLIKKARSKFLNLITK